MQVFCFSFKLKIILNYCSRWVSIRFLERIDPILPVPLSESERSSSFSATKVIPKKFWSSGNRRPIRYESQNGAQYKEYLIR